MDRMAHWSDALLLVAIVLLAAAEAAAKLEDAVEVHELHR